MIIGYKQIFNFVKLKSMGRFLSIRPQIHVLSKKRKYYKWHYLIPMLHIISIISLMREWGVRHRETVDGGEGERGGGGGGGVGSFLRKYFLNRKCRRN